MTHGTSGLNVMRIAAGILRCHLMTNGLHGLSGGLPEWLQKGPERCGTDLNMLPSTMNKANYVQEPLPLLESDCPFVHHGIFKSFVLVVNMRPGSVIKLVIFTLSQNTSCLLLSLCTNYNRCAEGSLFCLCFQPWRTRFIERQPY